MKAKLPNNAIESILKIVVVGYKKKWSEKDDGSYILTLMDKKEKAGVITLKNEEIEITGKEIETKFKKIKKMYDARIKKKITPAELKKSVFRSYTSENSDNFGLLIDNPTVFRDLNSQFEKSNIDNIIMGKSFTKIGLYFTKPTLAINCTVSDSNSKVPPEGFYTRIRNFLFESYGKKNFDNAGQIPLVESKWIEPFEKEIVNDIVINGTKVGQYFKERNLIHLFYNPFSLQSFLPLDDSIPDAVLDFMIALKELNVTTADIKKIKDKMFASAFLKKAREELKRKEISIKTTEKTIKDTQHKLLSTMRLKISTGKEISFLKQLLASEGTEIFNEIKKTRELTFVKKVEMGAEWIKITFPESIIKMPNFVRGSHTTQYGQRWAYLGEISVKISPEGFVVYNKDPHKNEYPHPHADSSGRPCFGSGEGNTAIYSLLAQNRISEVAKMLWFWTKIYRDSGAYIHQADWYDNRLIHGYPIWDEQKHLIKINDSKRIKTGEQRRLVKADDYEKNIKRFANTKLMVARGGK